MTTPNTEKTKTTLSISHWCRKVSKEMMRREGFRNFNQFLEHLVRMEWRRQQDLQNTDESKLPDPDGDQILAAMKQAADTRLNENPTGYAGTPTQVSSRQAVDVAKGAGAAVAQAVLASQSRSQSDTTASPNESTPEQEPASPAESSPPQSPPK